MSKPLWTLLLFFTGCLALWRGSVAGYDLWQYARLGPEVPAVKVEFEVVPIGSRYVVEGQYLYVYAGKQWAGKTRLSGPAHLNRGSTEIEIQRMEGMDFTVWVDASKPAVSSLEKVFPLKKTFYAICLLGVFLYFLYLRLHLSLLSKSF